jgi:hypothetical protein
MKSSKIIQFGTAFLIIYTIILFYYIFTNYKKEGYRGHGIGEHNGRIGGNNGKIVGKSKKNYNWDSNYNSIGHISGGVISVSPLLDYYYDDYQYYDYTNNWYPYYYYE